MLRQSAAKDGMSLAVIMLAHAGERSVTDGTVRRSDRWLSKFCAMTPPSGMQRHALLR